MRREKIPSPVSVVRKHIKVDPDFSNFPYLYLFLYLASWDYLGWFWFLLPQLFQNCTSLILRLKSGASVSNLHFTSSNLYPLDS